jgi:quinol monooxygenase YgiN
MQHRRTKMLIAILDFDVRPDDRDVALTQLLKEAAEVRAMDGNLAFRPYPDPEAGTRVTLLHEWRSRADFERNLGSAAFARSGAALRPMMRAAPQSRRFYAELVEEVA